MKRLSYAALTLIGLFAIAREGRGEEIPGVPDIELQIDCEQQQWDGPAGTTQVFPADVKLYVNPRGADPLNGVRAWSLSLRPSGGARIVAATTDGTDIPPLDEVNSYSKTEVTSGPENEGVVSAVVLSFQSEIQLPMGEELVILRLQVEGRVPESGCRAYGVNFVDGLMGSGQPVKNILTCGQGITRRDDGGNLDSDEDGYEPCSVTFCQRSRFIRGDINGDSHVNVSDSVYLLGFLFMERDPPSCDQGADVDADDRIDLSDAVNLLNYLFRGGPRPMPPFPDCGLPEKPGALSCALTGSCG